MSGARPMSEANALAVANAVGPGTISAGGDGVAQVVQIQVYAQASRILNSRRLAIQYLIGVNILVSRKCCNDERHRRRGI